MTSPRLAFMHRDDVRRSHGQDVADLVEELRGLRARYEQLAHLVDELLDTTPQTRERGVELVVELHDRLSAGGPR